MEPPQYPKVDLGIPDNPSRCFWYFVGMVLAVVGFVTLINWLSAPL